MTVEDLASIFDTPCSSEQLLQCKSKLLEEDIVYEEIVEGLFSTFINTNKSSFTRDDAIRGLVTYIGTTGETVRFIMELFQELLRRDGCTKEAIDYATQFAYKQAKITRARIQQERINEIKRQRAEQQKIKEAAIKEEAYLKKLEESVDMSKTEVSYDTAKFLIRNGFTYEDLRNKVNLTIASQKDIDEDLSRYRVEKGSTKEFVSIADVVGYDYDYFGGTNDLLKAFPQFFDSSATDGYRQRSLSMLKLTTENAMEALSQSFGEEPMKLADGPDGKFTVGGNGMHRYSVLRTLYCIEMAKADGNKEQEAIIYEKYKIPAIVSHIDYIKTYANFILNALNVASWVVNERDDNYEVTGRAKIELLNGEKLFFTDEELIAYLGNVIKEHENHWLVQSWISEIDTNFSKFLKLVIPEMIEHRYDSLEDVIDWGNNSMEDENVKFI